MISEGSCGTEDWSNDAENSAFHHRNKLHFTIYLKTWKMFVLIDFIDFTLFLIK